MIGRARNELYSTAPKDLTEFGQGYLYQLGKRSNWQKGPPTLRVSNKPSETNIVNQPFTFVQFQPSAPNQQLSLRRINSTFTVMPPQQSAQATFGSV